MEIIAMRISATLTLYESRPEQFTLGINPCTIPRTALTYGNGRESSGTETQQVINTWKDDFVGRPIIPSGSSGSQ